MTADRSKICAAWQEFEGYSPNQVLTHAAHAAAKQLNSATSGGRARREGLWLEQRGLHTIIFRFIITATISCDVNTVVSKQCRAKCGHFDGRHLSDNISSVESNHLCG